MTVKIKCQWEEITISSVEYWAVGATARSFLPLTVGDISSHLLSDWVPSLPASVSPSFIGWPPFLIEIGDLDSNEVLVLRTEAGRSERQWKGFLSWMLGVAGARHVLSSEGYRWIAPMSAFYSCAIQAVDTSQWNTSFPPSSIIAERRSGNTSRLFPDYLALRSTASTGSYDWAVAEAKGTQMSLQSAQNCPMAWSTQARNVVVKVNGTEIDIPRYLVIATRVNSNAKRAKARRLQLRAWNRTIETNKPSLSAEAAVDIAAAHLFGFFRGVHLRQNAAAIAFSVWMRVAARHGKITDSIKERAQRVADLADGELSEHSGGQSTQAQIPSTTVVEIDTDSGPIRIEIAEPLITLSRTLRQSETDESAAAALQEADSSLNVWEKSIEPAKTKRDSAVLPFGATLHLPRGFDPRDERR